MEMLLRHRNSEWVQVSLHEFCFWTCRWVSFTATNLVNLYYRVMHPAARNIKL
jgi:hypothetical protein